MNSILLFVGAGAVLLLGAFAVVFVRLASSRHGAPVDPEWLAKFSPARYRPMERLLSVRDFEFLAAQPGYTAALGRRMRLERRRILSAYLRILARDFDRLHRAARTLMLYAPEDRPEFAAAVMRQRVDFERAMFAVRFRVALNWIGGAPVDVKRLLAAVEALNAQVRVLAAAPAAA